MWSACRRELPTTPRRSRSTRRAGFGPSIAPAPSRWAAPPR